MGFGVERADRAQQAEAGGVVVGDDASPAAVRPSRVGDLDLVGLEDQVADGEHEAARARSARRCRCARRPGSRLERALASAFGLHGDDGVGGVHELLVGGVVVLGRGGGGLLRGPRGSRRRAAGSADDRGAGMRSERRNGSASWSPPRERGCRRCHPSTARREARDSAPYQAQPAQRLRRSLSRAGTRRPSSPRSRGRRAARSRRRCRRVPVPGSCAAGRVGELDVADDRARSARGRRRGRRPSSPRGRGRTAGPTLGRADLRDQRGAVGGARHEKPGTSRGVDRLDHAASRPRAPARAPRSAGWRRASRAAAPRSVAGGRLAGDAVDALVAERARA